jgi:hypothetical protein
MLKEIKFAEQRATPPLLCGSTVLGSRSRYVFMVFALRSFVVRGVSPTTGGSATCPTGRIPRLLRRADTAFAFIESHPV